MQDLPADLWTLIALHLSACDELRSIARACRDICSLQCVSRKTQFCGVEAFEVLSASCPIRHEFDYVLLPKYVSTKLFQHVYQSKFEATLVTLAMQQYVLSPEDLAHLDVDDDDEIFVPDFFQAAVQRWGSAAGLEKAKLAVLAAQIADQQPKLDRKNQIEKCLAKKGLVLRSDSRLCMEYIPKRHWESRKHSQCHARDGLAT